MYILMCENCISLYIYDTQAYLIEAYTLQTSAFRERN